MCMYDRALNDMAMSEDLIGQGTFVSSLPDEVMERILGLLPLQTKLVCRCVCKSWNSVLSTDNLLMYTTNTSLRNRSSGYGNAFFMLTTKDPSAYMLDPLSDLWHKLPKPACPGTSVLAAAHSLVCIGNQVSECRSLIIFNLLSNTYKVLPNTLRVGLLHKVTMSMDPSTHAYVVVVTGEDTSDFRGRRMYRLRTEVYDSASGSWRMAGDTLPEAKFGSDPGVWCNGLFYCITELPYGLTVFNFAQGRWMDLDVEMPKGIVFPSLVSCKGQLMMVGMQDDSAYGAQGAKFTTTVASSELQTSVSSSRLRLLPRSWSWSGPLQMWASSQLRLTLAALPSMLTCTSSATSQGLPLSPSSSLLSLPSSPLWSSLSSSPPSSSPSSWASSPPSSPSPPFSARLPSPSSPSSLQPRRSIKVWVLTPSKQWRVLEQMPEELCKEFTAHLTPRTALVCAGVGEEVCITSYQSPNTVIVDVTSKRWRYASMDPLFPKSRDAHMLGFTIQPDSTCVP
eukprot:c25669_g1_i1 orf=169-1692(-)